jgi:hypothetical protein
MTSTSRGSPGGWARPVVRFDPQVLARLRTYSRPDRKRFVRICRLLQGAPFPPGPTNIIVTPVTHSDYSNVFAASAVDFSDVLIYRVFLSAANEVDLIFIAQVIDPPQGGFRPLRLIDVG